MQLVLGWDYLHLKEAPPSPQTIGPHEIVEDVDIEAHAVEDGGLLDATERILRRRSTARWWTC